jgi:heat shock protein HslJ
MKKTILFLVLLAVFSTLLIAGCTTKPAPVPVPTTTVPTPVPSTVVSVATTAPTTDPALTGSWTLKGIMVGAGTSSAIPSTLITLTFNDDGTLSGFGGCNNYNANYVLTGRTTSFGKTISIGPILSSQKFCADTSDQESAYLANLQKAETYSITTNNMMIRASTLSQLSYVNGLG